MIGKQCCDKVAVAAQVDEMACFLEYNNWLWCGTDVDTSTQQISHWADVLVEWLRSQMLTSWLGWLWRHNDR